MKLSERQQAVAATAITVLSVLVVLATLAGLVVLVGLFVRAFAHILLPLAVAGVAALVSRPYFEWLHERLHLPLPLALVALFLSVLVPIAAFGWFFGAVIGEQLGELFRKLPDWWEEARDAVEARWPEVVTFLEEHPVGQRVRTALVEQGEALMTGLGAVGGKALSAGAGVVRGVGVLASWAVAPVYFAFFLLAGEGRPGRLEALLPFLKPETRRDVVFLAREFVAIVVTFFRGQLTVALLQGILFAVGFSLVGLRYGLLLGLVLGFLNIIPYLGSMVGLGVAVPLAWFQAGGGPMTVVWVLLVFTAVQAIEGYLLTPKIMGDRTGLHPMAIIVAVFFWGSALGGILGMILAIPLTAFLVVFWRLLREKYIEEWV